MKTRTAEQPQAQAAAQTVSEHMDLQPGAPVPVSAPAAAEWTAPAEGEAANWTIKASSPAIKIESGRHDDDDAINGQLFELCKVLTKSSLIPQKLRTTSASAEDHTIDCYVLALMGRGIGIRNPLKAFAAFDIINGEVAMRARTKLALVQRAGGKVDLSWDAKACAWTCTITRHDTGAVISATFGVQDAQRIGKMFPDPQNPSVLIGDSKSAWGKFWPDMLCNRAISRACDRAYADLLLGIRSLEDLDDSRQPAQVEVRYRPASNDAGAAVIEHQPQVGATQQDLQNLIAK